MIKKLLFASGLTLGCALFTNAQIQSQDFEGSTIPSGWTTQMNGPGEWTFGSNIPPFTGNPTFASKAAIFNDDALGDAAPSIASLLSPPVDVTSYPTLSLQFDYYMNEYSGDGTLKVEVYDGNTWQQLLFVTTDAINMTHVSYDVTAYKNAAFQVKYTFDDEAGWSWGAAVDNFLLQQSLGTEDFANKGSFSIYPNPASNVINLATQDEISSIRIYNVTGQLVREENKLSGNSVNVTEIPDGLYLITAVFSDNSSQTLRFIKK